MKIFNYSLHRSGTQSFAAFGHRLGLRVQHWPGDPFDHACAPALAGLDTGVVARLFAEAVAGHDVFADLPTPLLFRSLMRDHPDARHLLITRPVPAWIASVRRHTAGRELDVMEKLQYWAVCRERKPRLADYTDAELEVGYRAHLAAVVNAAQDAGARLRLFDLDDLGQGHALQDYLGCDRAIAFGNVDIRREMDAAAALSPGDPGRA